LLFAAVVASSGCSDARDLVAPSAVSLHDEVETMLPGIVVNGCADDYCPEEEDDYGDGGDGSVPPGDDGSPGDGGGGGDTGDPGAGDPGTPPSIADYDQDNDGDVYDDGLVLWGACIIAMVGSTMDVYDTASEFGAWYEASGALDRAERELRMVLENKSSHETVLLYQMERDGAQRRFNDAKNAVADAARASVPTLTAAFLTCTAALYIPSP
jgi:hypothetical protein